MRTEKVNLPSSGKEHHNWYDVRICQVLWRDYLTELSRTLADWRPKQKNSIRRMLPNRMAHASHVCSGMDGLERLQRIAPVRRLDKSMDVQTDVLILRGLTNINNDKQVMIVYTVCLCGLHLRLVHIAHMFHFSSTQKRHPYLPRSWLPHRVQLCRRDDGLIEVHSRRIPSGQSPLFH